MQSSGYRHREDEVITNITWMTYEWAHVHLN